ncbi:hypothetical protein GTP41_04690 [Pseudoduganella sp. DS3]|uniref:Uncharacterized protein n=1 Tax=Pseudoduganella guangdongensis TaxID=2692179 RepID=A0A6N9HD08_9BURK|nr:hypothetical protein [Pseudoduganella guangdongensis]MYN01394.1 hypothetical protein [Pseudoduganella guangdongensis]
MAIPRQLACVGLGTGALLLIPLAAMQFTDEVRWTLVDFILAGALLAGMGACYVLLASRMHDRAQKAVLAIVLGIGLLAVWMELAVGVFGTPLAGS